jgi:hypothetical protein
VTNLRPDTTSCRWAFRDNSCIDDGDDFSAEPPTKRPESGLKPFAGFEAG